MLDRGYEQTGLLETGSDSKIISGIEPIPPEQVIDKLELKQSPRRVANSVKGSIWGKADNGRIILECRNLGILQQPTGGSVNVYDFDDCLMSSSAWHRREYELVEQNETLRAQCADISSQNAADIYELSKILIPSVAEKEPRYTPRLNLVLLSLYADILQEGHRRELTREQEWEMLLRWRETIHQQVQTLGEGALRAYAVNPTIQNIFANNSPADFLYAEFVRDLLGQTRSSDIRIIATRGKIEGPLGQVDKVHRSGMMRQRAWLGQSVDLVVYSNDVKAEALLSTMNLLPSVGDKLVRVYDDNPNEILPYLKLARILGAQNIEVIQVSHPDAKRKDLNVGIEPTLSYTRGRTRLKHFSPNLATKQYYIGWDDGEEMQSSHARIISVPDGIDPREAAHTYLRYHERFHILEFVELVEAGKHYPRF